jgi:hypothetical protein
MVHVKESLFPPLENDVSPGSRTTELAVSTGFRFCDDAITNVLGCSIFYVSDGECMV